MVGIDYFLYFPRGIFTLLCPNVCLAGVVSYIFPLVYFFWGCTSMPPLGILPPYYDKHIKRPFGAL